MNQSDYEAAAGKSAHLLSPQFLGEMKVIYNGLRIRDPEEYLPILAAIIEGHRGQQGERAAVFIMDLRSLYSEIAPPDLEIHLAKLGQRFSSWREKTKSQMKEYFVSIHEDDPLRCPISLFGTMEYGRLETAHTRALAWLLDPQNKHGFKAALLRALLTHLLGEAGLGDIEVERLQPEFPIDDGRLDILVKGKSQRSDNTWHTWLLLIEAKVDADEGEHQLRKYEAWSRANRNEREVIRVFLTAEGRSPQTADEKWIPISFLQLACVFRRAYGTLKDQPGYHFLRYYLCGLLMDVCRWSLPVIDPDACGDPYNFIDYLETVYDSEGLTDDAAR